MPTFHTNAIKDLFKNRLKSKIISIDSLEKRSEIQRVACEVPSSCSSLYYTHTRLVATDCMSVLVDIDTL